MLQNEYLIAKFSVVTAENWSYVAKIGPFGPKRRFTTGPARPSAFGLHGR